ncbi:hypothetical protein L873DRAFT_1810301 [Choiromyces venosus 120613-1]|uniref:Uncharacterized protein n=1 Tax=Choiromyces venosus 120613-1 TaxID=1336337 RepID=A0A3N4JKW5_9PEZI|nr:hypothetical protein L873DRAFT_1810301 [Choiromyces venosus 120613-1]
MFQPDPLAVNPRSIPEPPSSPEDPPPPPRNPNLDSIAAVDVHAVGDHGQPYLMQAPRLTQPMLDHDAKWFERYRNEVTDIEAQWYKHYHEKEQLILEMSAEIAKLTRKALDQEAKLMKLEGILNLRGAVERTIDQARQTRKISHATSGVQAGLNQLAKTKEFQDVLAEQVKARRLTRGDATRCIPVVYHELSKIVHGNSGVIIIRKGDHTPNELAVLATILQVQSQWPDPLKWMEEGPAAAQ